MRPVILDTDIGTDVDDLLALVFLAKAPGLSLEAVTTVHGNTLLRAKLARIVCEKLGIPDLPTEKHIERLRSLPNGLGQLLESQIRDWWRFLKTDGNHPHDALAGLAMVHPELFSFATCDVAVNIENDQAGRVRRHDTLSGNVRAAYDLNAGGVCYCSFRTITLDVKNGA